MEPIKAILLGLIQGLTEFLPISSSGHLVLGKYFLGVEPNLFFDIMVHVGTLIAVLAIFSQDVLALLRAVGRVVIALWRRRWQELPSDADVRLLGLLTLAVVPTVLVGLTLEGVVSDLFATPAFVAVMLLVTGIILWKADGLTTPQRDLGGIRIREALAIGFGQALAIFPGISRSGTTIATGMAVGVKRLAAARFSFLLSIPTILGAAIFEAKGAFASGQFVFTSELLMAMLAAAVSGYLAIKLVFQALKQGKFRWFAYYVWAVGLFALLTMWFGK